MFRQVIAVVAVAVFAAVPALAQDTRYGAWLHSVNDDGFTRLESASSMGDEVSISVICLTSDFISLLLSMRGGRIFSNGHVYFRWVGGPKDGEVESYLMEDSDSYISFSTPNSGFVRSEVLNAISSLKSHSELRVRVNRWRNDTVRDSISLNGSSRAIDALSCMNP